MPMLRKVLIANRGEIAVRIIRTLTKLQIPSVAVYSDADADAAHVRAADEAVHIGPADARESYLNIERIIHAATSTGADAIHPGYGFLAENAAFARACQEAGITFIGPSAHAIETMGDKISVKNAVQAAGVPTVPGTDRPGLSDQDLIRAAGQIGYPVLIKPSAGGGGKGMYQVAEPGGMPEALESARREARNAFGDDALLLERFITDPRHIEVQVLADQHGTIIHLGERECSLQRRHQKIIEEAPSPLLDAPTRERIGQAAVAAARSVQYAGAGTVEFIISAAAPEEFFFIEMNTRLQVEHPVTELVTGIDLVEQQLRIAAGEPLAITQADITLDGHAIEARVYAENPGAEFLPTGGPVLELDEDGAGARIDSAMQRGLQVSTAYDPMIAKVIAHGPDRTSAIAQLDRALAQYVLFGFQTNVSFLRALLAHPAVQSGALDTGLIGREIDRLGTTIPAAAYAALVASDLRDLRRTRAAAAEPNDPWNQLSGWRAGRAAAPIIITITGRDDEPVRLLATLDTAHADRLQFTLSAPTGRHEVRLVAERDDTLTLDIDGQCAKARLLRHHEQMWVHAAGQTDVITYYTRAHAAGGAAAAGGQVRSPMPGTVIALHVEPGTAVTADQPLVVIEAMKMEHVLRAPFAGIASDLDIKVGDQVALGELLLSIVDDAPTPT